MKYLFITLLVSVNCFSQKLPTDLLVEIYNNKLLDTAYNDSVMKKAGWVLGERETGERYYIVYVGLPDTLDKQTPEHAVDKLIFYRLFNRVVLNYTTYSNSFCGDWENDLLKMGMRPDGEGSYKGINMKVFTNGNFGVVLDNRLVDGVVEYHMLFTKTLPDLRK
jgi:hypothetical protein